jgi:hypothetical protein
MPRIRYLKPEFFTDEDLAELPFQTRLFFEGLWCHADKEGRLEYRPRYLKAMIFPYDDVDVEKEVEILAKAKGSGKSFIRLYYTPEGLPLIQIVNWAKHQRPHHTEKDSVLPAPPDLPPTPPLKDMEKGMEKGSLHKASARLKNGELTVKEPLLLEDFEIFWKNYPPRNGRKAEKKSAIIEWKKLNPDKNLQSRILQALQKQVFHYQDCKKHDEFCAEFPDAHRWLKHRRWEDEVKLKTWQERTREIPE